MLTRLLGEKNSALAARFPLPVHFAISLLAAGRSKQRKANSEKSACAQRFACFVVSRNRFSLRPCGAISAISTERKTRAQRSSALSRPPSLVDQKNSALAARFPLSFHFAISLLAAGTSKESKASSEKKACAQRFACFVVL